jgi:hypothetical protein
MSQPLSILGVLEHKVLVSSLGDDLSDRSLFSFSLDSKRVLSDFSMDLLVQFLNVLDLCLGEAGFPLGELDLGLLLLFLL